ncbi:DinB family protein [Janthinobacterium psychrotolerans]|uniref:Putative damage-inducible protein DinB (Forms a four-helix bundle) n=1 Tax=Janthinobacterium psychrotolerans TaxID=1747903 RepID=A0A1A7C1V6_9BURK|nr:DinB family protein [Janthinobacterium psychrotolerans]OBV39717.1 putative damage-inducible protein DinB (forms a four-helix bundle) [Janthinobacterium psychrotolerans]
MHNSLAHYISTQAYNNAWANHRLYQACGQLSPSEFRAVRTSFFPTIQATLNHILTCDWFYLDALERELRGEPPHPDCYVFFAQDEPFDNCPALQAAQRASDERLIAHCRQLIDADLARPVTILRDTPQVDTRMRLLAHLFQHQIHHRGQVHAMLAGTHVEPPQLDEFYCAGEAELRAQDFAELGWTEPEVWGAR